MRDPEERFQGFMAQTQCLEKDELGHWSYDDHEETACFCGSRLAAAFDLPRKILGLWVQYYDKPVPDGLEINSSWQQISAGGEWRWSILTSPGFMWAWPSRLRDLNDRLRLVAGRRKTLYVRCIVEYE